MSETTAAGTQLHEQLLSYLKGAGSESDYSELFEGMPRGRQIEVQMLRGRVAHSLEQSRQHTQVSDLLNIGARERVEDVVVLDADAEGNVIDAIAKVATGYGDAMSVLWMAVENGKRVHRAAYTRDKALLMMLGVKHGAGDQAADYAERLFGFTDERDN